MLLRCARQIEIYPLCYINCALLDGYDLLDRTKHQTKSELCKDFGTESMDYRRYALHECKVSKAVKSTYYLDPSAIVNLDTYCDGKLF